MSVKMWTKVKSFYDSYCHVILWTIFYVATVWVIMRYMFNFNIFSAYRWHQLMHAHLHGFAGLVFGILILAMVPLYLATTILIARTGSPLFNIGFHIPQFIRNAFAQTPIEEDSAPTPEPEPEPEPAPEPQEDKLTDQNVPAEMRVAFERARGSISRVQTSAYDLGNITKNTPAPVVETTPTNEPESEMPIPTDFDINDAPVFTELNFDDDEEDISENEPVPEYNDIKTVTDNNDMVIKYLTAKSVPHNIVDDVVITNQFAIVSHTDSDFWVADNESWFAAGKIRRSPITSVINAAQQHNVQPVLYLGADNIMDIDNLRPQWERDGIRVITNLKDLM